MAGRRGLFKQRVVRARSGWSCAATSVSTVFHYWRDSALVRGVYWTGSFASEYYRLAKKTARVGLCSRRCGGPSWTALQAHACHRVWSAQLIPSADGAPSSQESQKWPCSALVDLVWQRYIGGPGSGPLERNWQAVSEKSKWAVSGANQRHAWLGCTRCAEPKPDLRLWGNHGSGSGWATQRPTTERSIQARSLHFRDSSYPRLLHTDWRGGWS